MPTEDTKAWSAMMIETGKIPDKDGYLHYNVKAIADPWKWMKDYRNNKEEE